MGRLVYDHVVYQRRVFWSLNLQPPGAQEGKEGISVKRLRPWYTVEREIEYVDLREGLDFSKTWAFTGPGPALAFGRKSLETVDERFVCIIAETEPRKRPLSIPVDLAHHSDLSRLLG